MADYCLHIGKLTTGIGLLLDVIGVIILVKIDIILLRIISSKEKVHTDDDDEIPSVPDLVDGKPIPMPEDFILEMQYPPEKNLKRYKLGFGLLIFGFIIQMIALFIDNCVKF